MIEEHITEEERQAIKQALVERIAAAKGAPPAPVVRALARVSGADTKLTALRAYPSKAERVD